MVLENPDDSSSRRNLGYILRKLNRLDEAVGVFVDLANEYAEDGFLLKAIATCKVVLEIDPHHTETQQRLAELYSSRTPSQAPELKVMADVGAVAPQAMGLSTDAIELPAAGGDATFQVQRTTPPDQLYGMVELPGAQPQVTQSAQDDLPVIEMIELEPLPLKPVGRVAAPVQALPETEPEPEPEPAPEPELEPQAEAQPDSALLDLPDDALTPLTPNQEQAAEQAPTAASAQGLPAIDIDVEFELDDAPPKQCAEAPEIPLFCELEPAAFVTLLERMNLVRMKPGQWILREGEAGSSMFTIASGKVRVLKRIGPKKLLQLAVLGEGAFFGEMSLLRGGSRGASVQAVESGELFEISRELIDDVARQYSAVEDVLTRFAHQRLLRNVMVTSHLFQPFNRKERIQIIEQFVSREVAAGEVLVTEGVESDGLYVVLRGTMEVFCRATDDQPILVGELGEGEVFGEISCLRKEPAIATVRAKGPGSILRLARSEFDKLAMSHPQILELVSQISDQRLAETSNLLAQKGILI